MTVALPIVAGLLIAAAVFLMLERNLVRYVLGLVLLGNGANLVLLVAGGAEAHAPPAFVPEGLAAPAGVIANPLPQALILTAIVIGFALLAFALVLAVRARVDLGTLDTESMRAAEPPPGSTTGPRPQATARPAAGDGADDSPGGTRSSA